MVQRGPIDDGWRDQDVKEALDLCLSCKGCKGDCPVNVDMATYKAEFLSHYWKGRIRPRAAYAFGLIDQWARLASLAPGLGEPRDAASGSPALAKALVGVPQSRRIPAFAAQNVPVVVSRAHAQKLRRRARPPLGRHVQQPLHARGRAGGRRRARGRRVPRRRSARAPVLRAASLRLRHARSREGATSNGFSLRCVRTSAPGRPSSCSSRAAAPSFATSSRASCRTAATRGC